MIRGWAVPAAAACLMACASTPPAETSPSEGSKMGLSFQDDGSPLFRANVEMLELRVDGTRRFQGQLRGATTFQADTLDLSPGPHVVDVRLKLKATASVPRAEILTASERFTSQGTGGMLTVDLRGTTDVQSPRRGIEVRFRIKDGTLVAGSVPEVFPEPSNPDAGAKNLDMPAANAIIAHIEHGESALATEMAKARTERDVIKLNCQNAKYGELNAADQTARAKRIELAHAIDVGDIVGISSASSALTDIDARIEALVAAAEQCIGEDAQVAPD